MYINRFSTTMSRGLAKKNFKRCKTDYTGHSTTCSVQLEMAQCKKWIFDILARPQNRDFGRSNFKSYICRFYATIWRGLAKENLKILKITFTRHSVTWPVDSIGWIFEIFRCLGARKMWEWNLKEVSRRQCSCRESVDVPEGQRSCREPAGRAARAAA